jgi:PilZ domain
MIDSRQWGGGRGDIMTVLWDGPAPQRIQRWVVSRRFDRVPVEFAVAVNCEGRDHRGRAVNLSEGGIAIISPVPLIRGREVTLAFSLPNVPAALTTTAHVRHASGFLHGCEFWGISPDEREVIAAFVAAQKK